MPCELLLQRHQRLLFEANIQPDGAIFQRLEEEARIIGEAEVEVISV
jgi:hypothetical protein